MASPHSTRLHHAARRGKALASCVEVHGNAMVPSVEFFVLARQTQNRLEVLARDVSECKSVDEAANFCRWLSAAGVLNLLEKNPQPDPLPVDGSALRKLAARILSECGDLYRQGKATPRYAASDIAEINRKLDIIAAHIGGIAGPPAVLPAPVTPFPPRFAPSPFSMVFGEQEVVGAVGPKGLRPYNLVYTINSYTKSGPKNA